MFHESRSLNGRHMFLGANPPSAHQVLAERPYAFTMVRAPRAGTVDTSKRRSLSRHPTLGDLRPEIENQGPVGACACFSGIACSRVAHRVAGNTTAPMLSGDWMYKRVRQIENSYPNDAGSTLSDNDDVLLNTGAPLESTAPEERRLDTDYDGDYDASSQRWISGHHAFYPGDGNLIEMICAALDDWQAIHIGVFWPQAWFSPVQGRCDENVNQAMAVGGHGIYIWGWEPATQELLLANQWGEGFANDAPQSGITDVRSGDFIVKAHNLVDVNSMGFEFRAVAPLSHTDPIVVPTNTDALWKWVDQVARYVQGVAEGDRVRWATAVVGAIQSYYPHLTVANRWAITQTIVSGDQPRIVLDESQAAVASSQLPVLQPMPSEARY